MSSYWSPSGAEVSVVAAASAVFTDKKEGLARIVNITTSIAVVAIGSVDATAGELLFTTIPGLGTFFVAFGHPMTKVVATVNPVRIQPGYAIK